MAFANVGLSGATVTVVENAGIKSAEELFGLSNEQLRSLPKVGPSRYAEIVKCRDHWVAEGRKDFQRRRPPR